MNFNNDDQLKAYLKKEANRLGISIGNTYTTYFSRLLLERIALMNYRDFIVTGSFSQFVYLEKLIRPITDVDLASKISYNDSLAPLLNDLNVYQNQVNLMLNGAPDKRLSGIYKLHIDAIFNKIKQPIQIDFNENINHIYEIQYKKVAPIFNGDKEFYINTPSFEEY